MCHRDEKNLQSTGVNDSRTARVEARVMGSMNKVHLVCSLLMAFCVSMFGLGCDAPKPKMDGAAPKMEGSAPKGTAKKSKSAGDGSTTGGGVEVPAAGGTTEAAPAAKADPAPEAKPDAATEAKPEEKKAE